MWSQAKCVAVSFAILGTLAAAPCTQAQPPYAPPPAFQVAPAYPPAYGGYLPYSDPYAGYLSGTANIIDAQGQWMQSLQAADMTKEHVRQAKIDTRKKSFDEYYYERSHTPTFEEDREFFQRQDLLRSMNSPPLSEIWSGEALNNVLAAIQKGPPGPGPTVPLDPNVVKHINLTSGASSQNAGLLRDGGRLRWPLVLRRAAFNAPRQQLDDLTPKAVKQAVSGNVDPDTIDGMTTAMQEIDSGIKQNIDSITPDEYSSAKRFLREMKDGIQVLQSPNAPAYLGGRYAATGDTVAQLVSEMTQKGLRFAPAVNGDQSAYVAVHTAFVTYNSQLAQLTARR